MPSMMKNQPMKDSYVGGLEESLAKKMKPFPPGMRQPKKTPKTPPREQLPYGKNKFSKPDKPMFGGKFGM